MHFLYNAQDPMVISQTSIEPTPHFVMYGKWLDSLSIMFGGAARITDQISVGLGLSVLANSELLVDNDIPVVTEAEVHDEWGWHMQLATAIYAGLLYQPVEELSLGLSYRSAVYHKLVSDTRTRIEFVGVLFQFDMLLESVAWYSPQQVALGAAYRLGRDRTLAADVTWYDWSAYPGPFIQASAQPDSSVAQTVEFPEREKPDFRDVFVPRLGLEYIHQERFAARLGYSLRLSPAPSPSGRDNILDADTHGLSLGFGSRWDLGKENPAAEKKSGASQPFIGVDVYFSLFLMPEQTVHKDPAQETLSDYSYGGKAFDAGLAITLGY